MLKKIRVVVSLLLFISISFYFIDFAGLLPQWFSWLEKIQFIPAVLSLSAVILVALIALTLLAGRAYCSSVCPMGIFQDVAAWFSKRFKDRNGKKKKYKYSREWRVLRKTVFVVAVTAFVAGFPVAAGIVEPYSAWGRVVVNLFKPVYTAGNNALEAIFTSMDNYTFWREEVFIISLSSFVVALVTFFAIGFMAWKWGRLYCNTICPVGTVLGYLSRFSLLKVRIDKAKCTSCSLCERRCKAQCIDSKGKTVDHTRCVDCFDCLGVCKFDALSYGICGGKSAKKVERTEKTAAKGAVKDTKGAVDEERRKFLVASLASVVAIPALAQGGEFSANEDNSGLRKRSTPIAPPGARSIKHLSEKCTSCHLCVSKCPSKVIKPSFTEYGIGGMMQPVMYFERGFCNFDCTVCGEVCPNGAIEPLTMEEKHLTQMGRVRFRKDICKVSRDGENCGACSEHCPTQAVKMMPYVHPDFPDRVGLTLPTLNPDICVGCGGCEYICPIRPERAIFIEGNAEHKEAVPFEKGESQQINLDGNFGF